MDADTYSARLAREDAARLRAAYATCPIEQWKREALEETARLEAKAERLIKEPV